MKLHTADLLGSPDYNYKYDSIYSPQTARKVCVNE